MKRVTVTELPACQAHLAPGCHGLPCNTPAEYDVPTKTGPWAHLCGLHKAALAAPGANELGFHLALPEPDDLHEDWN